MAAKIFVELALVGAIASVFIVAAQGLAAERAAEEAAAREYMRILDENTGKLKNKQVTATWNYDTNLTEHNEEILAQVTLEVAEEAKEYWKETMTYLWREFESEDLKRMFQKYSMLGTAALPEDLNQRLITAISNMKYIYAKATICDFKNTEKCDLKVEPEINDIFAKSDDPEELKHAWLEWHKAAGAASKRNFTEYVQMNNEAAKLNGFDNVAEWWLGVYETKDIEDQVLNLWTQLKPLYLQLHAYVRRHLRLKYGDDIVPAKGPIPAHLLGNIWAQTWDNVEKFTKPFPEKSEIDFTDALKSQNYTVLKIFKTAEDFFKSMNLMEMPELFWERSILEKLTDRDMVCHGSAWDFFDGEDFRIKQCTSITAQSFTTVHHEMGHIQYAIQYKDLPVIYRDGANPGFHEAVGDVISLSAESPKHLHAIGLMDEPEADNESVINQLYKTALGKIAFLPFSYLLDIFRYGVFRGTTSTSDYNCHFWQLRESIQGVAPPAMRTEEDFDPAAKYHVSADVEYLRYFISYIVQFQFHRSLCLLADQYTPGDSSALLYNCDIYNSTAAGNAFAEMLKLGSSKPWPDAMEVITGQRDMDASGLFEYFQPLYDWLKVENERTGEYIGWEASDIQFCTQEQRSFMENSEFKRKLNKYAAL